MTGTEVKKENIFDILAGTSSGAINASIVSRLVTKRIREAKSERKDQDYEEIWNHAVDKLYKFWRGLAVESEAERNPFFNQRWKTYKTFNESAASTEAARRWYSTRQFLRYGVKTYSSFCHYS